MGPYTFEPRSDRVEHIVDATYDNRRRLLQLAEQENMRVANTWFRKQERKLPTYREVGTKIGAKSKEDTINS